MGCQWVVDGDMTMGGDCESGHDSIALVDMQGLSSICGVLDLSCCARKARATTATDVVSIAR